MIKKIVTLTIITLFLFAAGCSSIKSQSTGTDSSSQSSLSGTGSKSATGSSTSVAGQSRTVGSIFNRDGQSAGVQVKQFFGNVGNFFTKSKGTLVGYLLYIIPILLILTGLYFLLFGRIGLLKKVWRPATSRR